MATNLQRVIRATKTLLDRGVWEPETLFDHLNRQYRHLHYATIRKAIHLAKSEIHR